jgi:hypothetical protein
VFTALGVTVPTSFDIYRITVPQAFAHQGDALDIFGTFGVDAIIAATGTNSRGTLDRETIKARVSGGCSKNHLALAAAARAANARRRGRFLMVETALARFLSSFDIKAQREGKTGPR